MTEINFNDYPEAPDGMNYYLYEIYVAAEYRVCGGFIATYPEAILQDESVIKQFGGCECEVIKVPREIFLEFLKDIQAEGGHVAYEKLAGHVRVDMNGTKNH